jgi:hypothetical protein
MPTATANGKKFTFPDGTTPDQMGQAIDEYFAGQQSNIQQPAQQEQSAPTATPAAEPDALQQTIDALQGFRDIPNATRQILARIPAPILEAINKSPTAFGAATKMLNVTPETAPNVDADIQQEEQAYQARRAAEGESGFDLSRIGGNIVGTAPLAALAPVSAAATLPMRTAQAAVQGGVVGAAQPVVNGGDFAAEKAKQIGIGAAVSGVLTPVAAGFSRLLSPKGSADVQKLLDEGITPTPGQVLGGGWARAEEKLSSIPLLGDAIKAGQRRAINQFNQAAYRRALDPIGGGTPEVGRKGMEAVRTQLNDAYETLLPKIQFKPDAQFVAELSTLERMAQNMPPQQADRFAKILADKVQSRMTPQGNMAGETLKGVESELTRLAKGYKTDASFDNRELGDALGEVLASVRRATIRVNPQYGKDLSAINLGWANYARLRRAASSVGAEGGVFTPAQLQNAVKAEASKGSKSAFSEGSALMQDLSEAGKNVLSSKVPNSGTTDRALAAGAVGAAGLAALPGLAKTAGIAAVPALGYTPWGQKMLASLLTQRPEPVREAGNMLLRAAPAIGTAGAAASNQLINSR